MKYTKGKWEIDYENADDYRGGQWYNVGPARLEIGYNPRDDERDEWTANAKLISKAPEMHEALKTIRTMALRRDNGHFDKPDHCQEIDLINSILKEIDNGQS